MPISRFDKSHPSEYVSQYVPIPLDAISSLAKEYSGRYKDAQTETDNLYDLSAKINAIPEHDQYKQQFLKETNAKIDKLSNDLAKTGDLNTFNRGASLLRRDVMNSQDRLIMESSYQNRALEQKEKIKLGAKYLNFLDPNRNYKGSKEDGSINPLGFNGIPEALDWQNRASELVKDIKSDGYDTQRDTLVNGIITDRRTGRESTSSAKVRNIANGLVGNFASTLEGKQYITKIMSENPNATEEQLNKHLSDYLYNTAAKQIFSKTTDLNNIDVTSQWSKLYDEKNAQRALIGQPIEGKTFDLTSEDKDYVELNKDGVYKKNNDGTLTLDWLNANADSKKLVGYNQVGGTSMAPTPIYEKVKSYDKYVKLNAHMKKMAESVGYRGDIKADNYQDILNKYNDYSKVRMYDEQMAGPVSEIETNKATNNWNNYDVMDIDSPDIPLKDKPTLEKGDELKLNNFRNTPSGKMNRDGFIKKANGDIVPVMVRPKGIIDNGYHDAISTISLNAAKSENGNLKPIGKTESGQDVMNKTEIPGIGLVETLRIYDERTGVNKSSFIITTDNNERWGFASQGDLQTYLNQKYYGTTTGDSETKYIAPPKVKYESTQSN